VIVELQFFFLAEKMEKENYTKIEMVGRMVLYCKLQVSLWNQMAYNR
jgi:hypothetical protein